ncbi:reverse transcriptase domain-containing protein [Tanacetum coccineum]
MSMQPRKPKPISRKQFQFESKPWRKFQPKQSRSRLSSPTIPTPTNQPLVNQALPPVSQIQASSSSSLPSNTIPNPRNEAKAITTRSGVSYNGPPIPPPVGKRNPSVVVLKKLPKKLGASINLMPLSIWKKLGLPGLNDTKMVLELANRTISKPTGVAENVFVKNEPPEVELKDLPPHLEYVFLADNNKLPVIIAKDLSDDEKTALIKVLKSQKQAIAWKLSDIKGINPEFRSHKILMEMTMNQLSNIREGSCDTNAVRLRRMSYYCFLDGFSSYFQILIDPNDQEKTTFTCPYGTFAYRRMPFGLCNAPGTFQRCMMAIFHDMIEKTMEVFMDDSSVRQWTEAESNYTTTEKEMLAVVYAFEKFRSYLIMNKSVVYTDHSALKYLFNKKDAKARLLRWVLLLQEFNFLVIDTKGAENYAADHLSRLENPYENIFDPKEINETFPRETLTWLFSQIRTKNHAKAKKPDTRCEKCVKRSSKSKVNVNSEKKKQRKI